MAGNESFDTPFRTHLSFFLPSPNPAGSTVIRPYDSIRASLCLGLNFPLSLVAAFGLHALYGNSGFLSRTNIDVTKVPHHRERSMLQEFPEAPEQEIIVGKDIRKNTNHVEKRQYARHELLYTVKDKGFLNKLHILGFWMVAADNETGRVSDRDVRLFQRGLTFHALAERRRLRDFKDRNVLPWYRGGPLWVYGHSSFAETTFGVKVYQERAVGVAGNSVE